LDYSVIELDWYKAVAVLVRLIEIDYDWKDKVVRDDNHQEYEVMKDVKVEVMRGNR
jgi:tetraacyldisaccharide-1-P 4'-kinase